ncbi:MULTISPECIES: nucleoside permease [Alteromonas]|jgi:nucleoside transporter|uniref:Major facilitator transporter n=2 Tax=Alteromonas australica TaxID=589873 RepID=A0A075P2G6_9ALTE|nr:MULTISPECIES: nucleoside permease [Alteromonas]AIF97542.1 major facilitator transporter [Alteromonas australica]QPL50432.1 nucleoside permease [Alteromonas sp. B31-7]
MINLRLSIMMFLQFFIWGGWFVTLGTYLANTLAASGGQIGMAFSTQSWGAIIAPFVVGLIADRFFNAERILGVLHIVGAILMYFMYQADNFVAFYPYVLGYMVVYMPTLALVNAVAFGQMQDPSKEFGKVRVWGTIGWIVAGLMISYVFSWDSAVAIADGQLRYTFLLCAVASLLLGVFSFSLPNTPPKAVGQKTGIRELLGLDALVLLKDKNFLVFFLSSVLICIPLAFYYQNANPFLTEIGVENATGKMTLGQVSEVLFMLALPIFLNRFGLKVTLLIGMAAWVLRYVLFAYGNADETLYMLIVGIALHGICYDFFFVSGQIYTDAKAGESAKSAAQGLITLATYGVGMLVGFAVAGMITDRYTTEASVHEWQQIWLFPAAFAAVVFLIFLFMFKSEKEKINA